MEVILKMEHISKRFSGVQALNDVSLELERGEILALLGENGAGKSTLINILAGAQSPDSGEIVLEGKNISPHTPREMIDQGISVVYQELNYLNDLSIAENIFLGNLPLNEMKQVDYKALRENTIKLLGMVGLNVDPMLEVGKLSIAQKQIIEIAKVIAKNGKVIIMDEPTSALNEKEIQTLFSLLRSLAVQKKSVIFISHKLEEIFDIADRVQVLRDGCSIGSRITKKTNIEELVSMMVGRVIKDMYPKEIIPHGETVIKLENISSRQIKNISLQIRKGEILGLFGLMGSGRTEIAETLFGVNPATHGIIKLNGKEIKIRNPREAVKYGIVYVPRERKKDGLVLQSSVRENMTLTYLRQLQGVFKLNLNKEKNVVNEWIDKLRIKTPSINTPIESLSGGNQQKVAFAKWIITSPKVLILNEPTRGVDVGAKVEIYKIIEDLCKSGLAIMMISSESPEIMGISDRIIVVHEGKITGECMRSDFNQEKIMCCAIGSV
jgi:ABC-type sugar transport system ATPase subunit